MTVTNSIKMLQRNKYALACYIFSFWMCMHVLPPKMPGTWPGIPRCQDECLHIDMRQSLKLPRNVPCTDDVASHIHVTHTYMCHTYMYAKAVWCIIAIFRVFLLCTCMHMIKITFDTHTHGSIQVHSHVFTCASQPDSKILQSGCVMLCK